jgi:hypothetical protein
MKKPMIVLAREGLDQKVRLALIERRIQERKAAGKSPGISDSELEWVIEVAKRAPRIKRGRPPITPRKFLEAVVENLQRKACSLNRVGGLARF